MSVGSRQRMGVPVTSPVSLAALSFFFALAAAGSRRRTVARNSGNMVVFLYISAFWRKASPFLLGATIDLILERNRDLLKRGTVLVDPDDPGEAVRALFYLEHTIQDGRTDKAGNRRVVSRQLQFVETDATGSTRNAGYAPYLDYRPATPEERTGLAATLESQAWLKGDLESVVVGHAIANLVPVHLDEVRNRREDLVTRTMAAVKDRLTKEITYWDHRANQLKDQELVGKTNAKINSGKGRQRADELQARLQRG